MCLLSGSCYVGTVLNVFRRHAAECPGRSRGRRYRRCDCPIHVEGSLRGEYVRKAMNLTSWEAASDLVAAWTAAGEVGVVKPETPTVKESVKRFFEDCTARHLRTPTIEKLKLLLEKQLIPYCDSKGYRNLKQLDVAALRQFRATWKDAPISAYKKLERLRSFFKFCHQAGWIKTNPVLQIKPPKVHPSPTLPFTTEEMKKTLDACEKFPVNGIYGEGNRKRLRALVLLLRYSGLRIRDAITLKRDRLTGNKLFLYTQKTGTPVFVPLPPRVVEELRELNSDKDFFFWSGNSNPKSAVGNWQRSLRTLFEVAAVDGHAHRFRDTFAVELLLSGVPLDQVSVLLGHSSTKITEKHYSPWVRARQERLEELVKRSWNQATAV